MSDTTTNLALPYILAAQAQKHVTHNEALRMLDGIVQLSVRDWDLTAPPGSPSEGDRYIVAPGATGDWTGWDGDVALWTDGAWVRVTPNPGWRAWFEDEARLVVHDGAAWVSAVTVEQLDLPRFKAHPDADTLVTVGSWTTLALTSTEINAQGGFDTAAYRFVAPVEGTYQLGATLLYKVDTSTTARMRGRLLLNGATEIRGSFGEVSGGHTSGTTTLALQTVLDLTVGDTVELQASFRVADGYIAADHTSFWGARLA